MNNLQGGLWTKSYNEIYGVIGVKETDINNVCQNPELKLTCLQAKFLKYILKANLKLGEQKIKFVENNELKCEELKQYIDKLSTTFNNTIDEINVIKNEKEKNNEGTQIGGNKILEFIAFVIRFFAFIIGLIIALIGAVLLVVASPVALISSLSYLIDKKTGDKVVKNIIFGPGMYIGNIGLDIVGEVLEAEKRVSNGKKSGGGGNKKTLSEIVNNMNNNDLEHLLKILNFISNIIVKISKTLVNKKSININKICVNEQNNKLHPNRDSNK